MTTVAVPRPDPPLVPGSRHDLVVPESAEFELLVMQAQSDDPEAAIGPLREWILRSPADTEFGLKLRVVLIMAYLFARRLPEAIDQATETAAAAAAAGFPAWQADALAQRAMAHWENNDRTSSARDVIAAEALLDSAGPELAWMSAHNSVASLYVESGYYELAIDHYEKAAAVDRSALTCVSGNVADAMNLGWLYLRWTFDAERAGMLTPGDPVYQERMGAALRWYSAAVERGGSDHRWAAEYRAGVVIVQACLDPLAHVDELARVCQLDLGPAAENDRIIETVRYSYVLRRLGRHAESLAVAERLATSVESPWIWQATIREVLYELHRAQLGMKIPGSAESSGYLDALLADLWEQRRRTMAAFRLRRDVAVVAARQEASARLLTEDPLTGLPNRRAMQQWWDRHPVGPVTVAMIDLDGFHEVNRRFGHPVGDAILIEAAAALQTATDPANCLVRYGGDEFVLLSAEVIDPAALRQQVAAALSRAGMQTRARGARLTASVGIVTVRTGESTAGLVEAADAALIEGKRTVDHRS